MTRTLPRKRRPGRPKARDSLSRPAVESIVRSALDVHGLTGIEAPERWGVKAGIVLLARLGLDPHEIAERFGVTDNIVQVHCHQYRKKHGVTLEAWKAEISANIARRHTGRGPTTLEPLRTPREEPEAPPDLTPEIWRFINTIWLSSLQAEARAQGRGLSFEEVAALPEHVQLSLNQQATIRDAQRHFGPKQ